MQLGWILGENGQVGYVLSAKLEYDKEKTEFMSRLTTLIGIGSIALGSIFGGSLLQKYPERTLFFSMVAVSTLGAALVLIQNMPLIIIGKVLKSIPSGVLNVMYSKCLNSTIPVQFSQAYGVATNAGICFGLFLVNLLQSLIIPEVTDGLEALSNDQNWRIVYGGSLVLNIVPLLIVAFRFPQISLQSMIEKEQCPLKQLNFLSCIYEFHSEQHALQFLHDLKNSYKQ